MAAPTSFAAWLAAAMAQHGLSRLDVAAALRVYYNHVLDWLAGNELPNEQQIKLLAEYFETTPGRLLAMVHYTPVNLGDDPELAID